MLDYFIKYKFILFTNSLSICLQAFPYDAIKWKMYEEIMHMKDFQNLKCGRQGISPFSPRETSKHIHIFVPTEVISMYKGLS